MSTGTQILLGVVIALVLFGGWLAMRRRRPVERRPVTPDLDARLRELAADGKQIVAIKELRQATGMGLREAKEHVFALTPEPPRRDLDRVLALVAQGKKIEAIKEMRERTGWNLADAKAYVDRLAAEPPVFHENPDHLARVRELAAAGRKIEAIKVQRQYTGMGLKQAKQFVEALEITGEPPAAPRAELSLAAMAQVRELMAAGKTIQAVKLVREDTGWGLKQAKNFVDSL
jgi:ribosomal protein L7/L12